MDRVEAHVVRVCQSGARLSAVDRLSKAAPYSSWRGVGISSLIVPLVANGYSDHWQSILALLIIAGGSVYACREVIMLG